MSLDPSRATVVRLKRLLGNLLRLHFLPDVVDVDTDIAIASISMGYFRMRRAGARFVSGLNHLSSAAEILKQDEGGQG